MTVDSARVRVLVVDDSELFREALSELYSTDAEIEVVAQIGDGEAVLDAVRTLRPNIVSLDLGLPGADGFDVVQQLMDMAPLPILVVTATMVPRWRRESFYALELGALDVMQKPDAHEFTDPTWRKKACDRLKMVARSPVIRHVKLQHTARVAALSSATPTRQKERSLKILVFVGSAGSPSTVLTVLDGMREALPLQLPIVIAIHLGAAMVDSFARHLAEEFSVRVAILQAGVILEPGVIYLAPGGVHTEFRMSGVEIRATLPNATYIPSFDYLLGSVARQYGAFAAAVTLSGMGDDGARGMLEVANAGGLTLAQSPESCLSPSMPASALAAGAIDYELPPTELARELLRHIDPFLRVA